jgi:hypothetical protein
MKYVLIAAFALVASPAFAKVKRHCVSADGSEMSDATTKKQCKKAHGKWKTIKASDTIK